MKRKNKNPVAAKAKAKGFDIATEWSSAIEWFYTLRNDCRGTSRIPDDAVVALDRLLNAMERVRTIFKAVMGNYRKPGLQECGFMLSEKDHMQMAQQEWQLQLERIDAEVPLVKQWSEAPLEKTTFRMWKALLAQAAMNEMPPHDGESDDEYVKRIRERIKAPIDERRGRRAAAVN